MERDTVTRNADQARDELQALDGQVIDEDELRQALGQFDPVWEHLVSNEKRHVLKTLIEQVTFNGTTSEVEVDVSPSGVRLLSDEERSETA